ncbi:MAG: trypsin-like peptidase domain-containing protein [Marinibacterium sp.]
MSKISIREFRALLEDPDTPIETLRYYVRPMEGTFGGFDPSVVPDPDKVDMNDPDLEPGMESAMGIGNGWSRSRRRRRFKRRMRRGETLPVIVSEGDSWFQFPILIDDVIDHLDRNYLVWSLGAAGDTADNMIRRAPEYLDGLREQADHVQAFLLSAAGNDVLGEDENGTPTLQSLLHRFRPGKTAEELVNKSALRRTLNRLEERYREVVDTIRAEPQFDDLPILFHGYDYVFAFPAGPGDRRQPIYAAQDKWLGRAFDAKGIADTRLRRDIIVHLVDSLYDMLDGIARDDAHVHVVDVRETLTRVSDWADEIHGTSEGFGQVAGKFHAVLSRVTGPRLAHETVFQTDPAGTDEIQTDLDTLSVDRHSRRRAGAETMGFGDIHKFSRGFRAGRDFEALIGTDDSVPFWFLTEGAARGRAVGKIEASGTNFKGETGRWSGTGFLIAPNVLLTNAHVINSAAVGSASRVLFDFAEKAGGGSESQVAFRLDPSRLFLASDPRDLDYCFVWVDGDAHDTFGTIPFWRGSFMGGDRQCANIIHHPRGEPKRASLKENEIVVGMGAEDTLIHYLSDTEPGSSGSPVLTDQWKLFALHHASARIDDMDADLRARMPRETTQSVLNEGIKTSAIAADVEMRSRSGPGAAHAREVLRHISGTDSRTGFFGALGRQSSGRDGFERVVDTYSGAPRDVDIAFWNIEWFNRDFADKIDDVVRVIADLNLDIWALEEVSPRSTEALVKRLNRDFGQKFDYAVSEPGASDGKQTTTVIWNSLTVQGERLDWPEAAHTLLKLDSRDPDAAGFEAVEGKLFNRYPGLFRFSALNRTAAPFDFNLVPLHLKARGEGAKRRKMASNALARAIEIAVAADPSERDWVIGGDMNAELATGQFNGLTGAGFTALGAADENDGAFTYLKHPHRSMIDSIFLSPGMAALVGADDFMVVAADRVYADFVRRVSDHRPVMVRLSLDDTPDVASPVRASPGASAGAELFQKFLAAFRADPDGSLRALADLVD